MAKTPAEKYEAKLEAGIPKLPPGRYGFGGGLWLEVEGGRSWAHRYSSGGKARHMGLGSYPAVTLRRAREKVAENRALLDAGTDPIDARRSAKTAEKLAKAREITFDAAADAFIVGNAVKWRDPKNEDQWRSSLRTYASPIIGKLPLSDINTDHVLRVLRPIWTTKAETAVRVRGRIETVLAFGIAQGWCTEPNPARWHAHLQMILPPRSKVTPVIPHAALGWRDLPGFMTALRDQEGASARALAFIVLTGARAGEVRGATWDEVDLDAAVWTVPAARMKAGRVHVVPLSDPALALLREAAALRGTSQYIFPGMKSDRPLSDMALLRVLTRLGRPVTIHGFRATLKTWASDQTEHPREIIEACLAHAVGDASERAYQRGSWLERRRRLMNEWAAFACALPADNVVALARAG